MTPSSWACATTPVRRFARFARNFSRFALKNFYTSNCKSRKLSWHFYSISRIFLILLRHFYFAFPENVKKIAILRAKRATTRGLAFDCQIRMLVKIIFWISEIILFWVHFEIGYCFSFYFLHIINWHVGVQLLVLISVKPPKLRSWICKKLGSAESAVSDSCMRGHALSIISYWVLSRHEIAHDSGCHPPW